MWVGFVYIDPLFTEPIKWEPHRPRLPSLSPISPENNAVMTFKAKKGLKQPDQVAFSKKDIV